MCKNPWARLLAGAATIIVVTGSIACKPTGVDNGNTLGVPAYEGVDWGPVDPDLASSWENVTF